MRPPEREAGAKTNELWRSVAWRLYFEFRPHLILTSFKKKDAAFLHTEQTKGNPPLLILQTVHAIVKVMLLEGRWHYEEQLWLDATTCLAAINRWLENLIRGNPVLLRWSEIGWQD
jgi:hypothetical protein